MSRIGKKPVSVPQGVSVDLQGRDLKVKGPKGELEMILVEEVLAKLENDEIIVTPRDNSQRSRSMWGMQRTLIENLIAGVAEGFSRGLEIQGVGYRAAVQGNTLTMQLGFSHEVKMDIPEGIEVKCPTQTEINVSGNSKQRVGQFAAEIREWRKPEPYKGKGIRYKGEYVFRKEGKKK
ncbi:MAG: 50S ribosomal protein L6 [Alphaproteobacteria bacterium]|nr:MAG: 50S ribosomal protein L6 [Alphaproteobacteria bacterium]